MQVNREKCGFCKNFMIKITVAQAVFELIYIAFQA